MKQKDIEFFEELLNAQLKELLGQAGETMANITDANDSFADPSDRASFEADQGFMLRIRDRESKLINKIHEALERLKTGTYGICEMCGEDISVSRLKARPVTTLCIQCKTKSEAFEKVAGI